VLPILDLVNDLTCTMTYTFLCAHTRTQFRHGKQVVTQ